ncbi:hypothetical protein KZQ38_00335 [Saccharothrix sp. SC076]|nr:hypothetical protein [Saccharothrix obliqua]
MIGHVVVVRRESTLAVWHVDTEGLRTGAWDEPVTDARRVLDRCRKRAVLTWDGDTTALEELEAAAGVGPTDWAARTCALPDLLAEIGRIRAAYQERIVAEQAVKKNVAPLEWQLGLPDPVPATAAELQELARLDPLPAPTPAATEALLISRLCAWVVQRWRETAVVLGRRDYLRAAFGQPTVLPPGWEAKLADAFAQERQASL